MRKIYFILPLTAIVLLIALSLFAPSSAAVWLASTSLEFTLIRIILALALVGLIVTNPPRKIWFRLVLGAIALFLAVWSLVQVYSNELQFVDFLIFMQVGISFAISALERTPEEIMADANRLLESGQPASKNNPAQAGDNL